MTARHRRPPTPRRRIAAWNAAANRIPEVARWGLGAAAVVLCVAGTVGAARSVAPQVAAQESLAFPEQVAEPTARGGRLVIPSIGVVAETSTVTAEPPPSFVRDATTYHARPGFSPRTVADRAPTVTTGRSSSVPEPTTSPPTQAATTTPAETTAPTTTTAAPTSETPTTEPEATATETTTTEPPVPTEVLTTEEP